MYRFCSFLSAFRCFADSYLAECFNHIQSNSITCPRYLLIVSGPKCFIFVYAWILKGPRLFFWDQTTHKNGKTRLPLSWENDQNVIDESCPPINSWYWQCWATRKWERVAPLSLLLKALLICFVMCWFIMYGLCTRGTKWIKWRGEVLLSFYYCIPLFYSTRLF